MTANTLPSTLYQSQALRELDQLAISTAKIPGITLMRRAASAVLEVLQSQYPKVQSITVFCGNGNNGGDGYIVAGMLKLKGYSVQLINFQHTDTLRNDAKTAALWAIEQRVNPSQFNPNVELQGELIIDAIFGTGLNKPISDPYQSAIQKINGSEKPVIAVDIPSGLACDTGAILGCCVKAAVTVSFIGLKVGLFTHFGPDYSGRIFFNDLAIPTELYQRVSPSCQRIDIHSLTKLPKRQRNAHKGNFGHTLIIGGDSGFGGAVIMAAEAAARTGSGLSSVLTKPEHIAALLARRPEIMAHATDQLDTMKKLINQATAIVIGPGLGQSTWAKSLMEYVLQTNKPLVIDADALHLLKTLPTISHPAPNQWILTPHPGEAASLLDTNTADIQNDRLNAAKKLYKKFQQVIVLKGCGTIICSGLEQADIAICTAGNPGMASGGMGDVLSGIIGGLLAQGLSTTTAAQLGVVLHSTAADQAAAAKGERGLLATDLLAYLQQLNN